MRPEPAAVGEIDMGRRWLLRNGDGLAIGVGDHDVIRHGRVAGARRDELLELLCVDRRQASFAGDVIGDACSQKVGNVQGSFHIVNSALGARRGRSLGIVHKALAVREQGMKPPGRERKAREHRQHVNRVSCAPEAEKLQKSVCRTRGALDDPPLESALCGLISAIETLEPLPASQTQ